MSIAPGRALSRFVLAAGAGLSVFGAAEYGYRLRASLACEPTAKETRGVFDLYAAGESIMQGQPYSGITPPVLVSRAFDGRLSGRRIIITNLARRGQSIYPQSVALERALRCRDSPAPGAVLIYAGNNDSGRPSRVPLFEYAAAAILSRSLLLRDLHFFAEERFLIPRHRTLETYEYHLRRAVDVSLGSGLVPILSTVIPNVSDMDPGLLAPKRKRTAIAAMRDALRKGETLETQEKPAEALAHYRRFLGEAGMRPYLLFKMGKCYQTLGRHALARSFLWLAVDGAARDHFGRATRSQAAVVRRLARERGLPLVDAVELFEGASPHGVTGNELFADGVHPNLKGLRLLSREFADKISKLRHEPIKTPIPAPEDIFRTLAYPKRRQIESLLDSGRWLFSVSTNHVWPQTRLRLATKRFTGVLAVDPRNFSAWFGLGLTQAAMNGEFLLEKNNIDWLSRMHLFYGADYRVSREELPEAIARMRSNGTAEPVLERLSALRR